MHAGPVVIGFDGTPASEHALREAGHVLAPRPALVVTVWTQGLGFEALESPTAAGFPPAPIDVRTALDLDDVEADRARRVAQRGADIAREVGFDAEGLAVAEELDVAVAETLVDIATKRGAQAMVVGAHGHGRLSEIMLGSTTRDVLRRASCPVVVVREA